MPSFGEKLRHERESRNTPLQDVARRTQIGIQYLEALERNDFDGLPGRRGFGKLYIRAYAEVLGFDPEPLIEEYDREQLRQERPEHAEAGDDPARPRRIRFVPRARRRSAATQGEPEQPTPAVTETMPAPSEPEPPTPVVTEAKPAPSQPPSSTPAASEAIPAPSQPESPIPAVAETMPTTSEPESPTVAPTWAMPAAERPTVPASWWNRRTAGVVAVLLVLGALGVASRMRTARQAVAPEPGMPLVAGPVTPKVSEPAKSVDAETTEPVDDRSAGAPAPSTVTTAPVQPAAPAPADPPPLAPAPNTATARPVDPRPLEVPEFGLGTDVVNRRLVHETHEFEEGSRASFLTRVRGAAPGQTIRHAWIREGRLVQSIELPLGSPDWRTYSNKTLWGTGNWTVEARDASGATLARVEFRCVPARH